MTPLTANAGVDDILFGVTGNRTAIVFSTANAGHFPDMFSSDDETASLLPASGAIGGCFISASISELAGIGIIFGLCLVGLLIGLKLVINDPPEEEVIEKVK
jgi:hypothetical protein